MKLEEHQLIFPRWVIKCIHPPRNSTKSWTEHQCQTVFVMINVLCETGFSQFHGNTKLYIQILLFESSKIQRIPAFTTNLNPCVLSVDHIECSLLLSYTNMPQLNVVRSSFLTVVYKLCLVKHSKPPFQSDQWRFLFRYTVCASFHLCGVHCACPE